MLIGPGRALFGPPPVLIALYAGLANLLYTGGRSPSCCCAASLARERLSWGLRCSATASPFGRPDIPPHDSRRARSGCASAQGTVSSGLSRTVSGERQPRVEFRSTPSPCSPLTTDHRRYPAEFRIASVHDGHAVCCPPNPVWVEARGPRSNTRLSRESFSGSSLAR